MPRDTQAHPGGIAWPRIVGRLMQRPPAEERATLMQTVGAETVMAYPEPVAIPSPPGELARVRHQRPDFEDWAEEERRIARDYARSVEDAEERNHGSLLAILEAIATLRAADDPTATSLGDELAKRAARDYPGLVTCLADAPRDDANRAQLPPTLAGRRRLARAASRDWGRCPKAWRYA